jgi:hypothetical protein
LPARNDEIIFIDSVARIIDRMARGNVWRR